MRIVIKIGSNILTGAKDSINKKRIDAIAASVSKLHDKGHQMVIVSSGAVAAGMRKLGLKKRPTDIQLKQAAAAAGQSALMWKYERGFHEHGKKIAQVLLTRDVLSDRKKYINSKGTLFTLLEYGIIPIINENDTVATEEIRFGDNDQLAALVAALIEADRLVMLSDVDGLYTDDPNKSPNAELIKTVDTITDDLIKKAGASSSCVGTGGMYSKLLAAQKATRSGITVNIINGSKPSRLVSLINGRPHGTVFKADKDKLSPRKGWIAYGIKAKGTLTLDEGAVKALTMRGKSLLPSGIIAVDGTFETGDAVACVDSDGTRIAKGLANYSSDEVRRIMGMRTSQIEKALGYRYSDEVLHRNNIVLSR